MVNTKGIFHRGHVYKENTKNECTLHIGHRLCNVEIYHTQIGRCMLKDVYPIIFY
jgi:hypothetical protein